MTEESPDGGLMASYPPALSIPLHILIVDDEESFAGLVARQLNSLQEAFPRALIEVVHTRDEAERIIASEPPPNVALLDLKLPRVDGAPDMTLREAVERAMKLDERTAVVIITGHRKEDVEELLIDSHIEVLHKNPSIWLPGNIIRAIVRALERKQLAEAKGRFSKVRGIVETLKQLGYGSPETP